MDNFLSTSKHLTRIPFTKNMVFSYWDHKRETDDKYINLREKKSFAAQLSLPRSWGEKNVPVAVLAGFEHLPFGGLLLAYTRIPKLGLVLSSRLREILLACWSNFEHGALKKAMKIV